MAAKRRKLTPPPFRAKSVLLSVAERHLSPADGRREVMSVYSVVVVKDGQQVQRWQVLPGCGLDPEQECEEPCEQEVADTVFEEDLTTVLRWFQATEEES
jgi:myo-inositol-1-phosphate synthase